MTTREYTKLLSNNDKISKIEIKGDSVVGTITLIRFRPKENKEIVTGNDTIKITRTEVVGNEVDIIFSGRVKSSRGGWYETKQYTKTTLTRWLRTHSPFVTLIENRILLIGGDKDIKIKKIDLS